MQIYLVRNGRREGPFTLYQVHEMVESGEIDGNTLGWMPGEGAWKPARELPPVLSLIQSVEKEKLDAELARTNRPNVPPVPPAPSVPPHRLPSHAFSRFGARMIDVMLFQILLSFFWALPEPPESMPDPQDYANLREFFVALWDSAKAGNDPEQMAYAWKLLRFQLGSVFGWHLLEPCFLAFATTTPGKAVFRIRVLGPGDQRPEFFRALYRSLLVFVFGMGFGFEPLRWIANFFSYLRLQGTGLSFWDEQARTRVDQQPLGPGRALFILGVLGAIILLDQFLPR